LTVASTILPRDAVSALLHELFQMIDRGLHGLGRLQNFGDDQFIQVE